MERPAKEDAASLEETNEILGDPALMEAISEAEAEADLRDEPFSHAEILDDVRRRRSAGGA